MVIKMLKKVFTFLTLVLVGTSVFASPITVEQVKKLDFGTLVIPIRGKDTIELTPRSETKGSGIVLGKAQAGEYIISLDKAMVVNIDIRNSISGSKYAKLNGFSGRISANGRTEDVVFPTVVRLPQGNTVLQLGAKIEYTADLKKDTKGINPEFDIIVEQ
jgi:hypothetical protein